MAKLCPTRGEDRIVILSLVFVLDYCFNQGCDLMGGNRKRENKENEGKKRKITADPCSAQVQVSMIDGRTEQPVRCSSTGSTNAD